MFKISTTKNVCILKMVCFVMYVYRAISYKISMKQTYQRACSVLKNSLQMTAYIKIVKVNVYCVLMGFCKMVFVYKSVVQYIMEIVWLRGQVVVREVIVAVQSVVIYISMYCKMYLCILRRSIMILRVIVLKYNTNIASNVYNRVIIHILIEILEKYH